MQDGIMKFDDLALEGEDFVNPRTSTGLGAKDIKALAKSIELDGLLNPIIVWGETGVILAGQRRYKAIEHLIKSKSKAVAAHGLKDEIPVRICEAETVEEAMMISSLDNLAREDLSKYEEMNALIALAEMGFNQTQIAARTGRSKSYISRSFAAWKKASEPLKETLRDNPDDLPFDTFKDIATTAKTEKSQEEMLKDYLSKSKGKSREEKGKARAETKKKKAAAKAASGKGRSKKPALHHLTAAQMRAIMAFLEETDLSNAWERGYQAGILYACTSEEVYDPQDEAQFEKFSAKFVEWTEAEDEEPEEEAAE